MMPNLAVRSGRRRPPVSRFVRAAMAGDQATATTLALDFMAEKGSRATVITDLFQGAQLQIGDRWHLGQATAADEYRVHVAIAAAMAALPKPTPSHTFKARSVVLCATLWPERHDLGLNLVAAALGDDGWEVDVVTGFDSIELVARASQIDANLVCISLSYPSQRARAYLSAVIQSLHSFGVPVMVGGLAFVRAPRLADEIGADSSAADVRSAVILARRLRVAHGGLWTLRGKRPA
jgi:methanogenic corrinoid protein MtbC1